MSLNSVPVSTPPRFCSQDGMVLMRTQTEQAHGFDPFTGYELPKTTHITLRCPTAMHDVWVLVGNNWVRP